MRIEVYYSIRPTNDLVGYVASLGDDGAGLIAGPFLWCDAQGGITSWNEEDYCLRIKLLFLSKLHYDYAGSGLFDAFLSGLVLSEEHFDKWWVLERYDFDEATRDLSADVHREMLRRFRPTGNAHVDSWISLIRRKLENQTPP